MTAKLMKSLKSDKRKIKALVESKSFDLLIMSLICLDAIALGILSIVPGETFLSDVLFILDRLFLAIFIVEMIMKLFVYRSKFFNKGWNVFDLSVISISASSVFGYFIILRTFRLFRLLRYAGKFSRLKQLVNVFIMLLPNFAAMTIVFMVFLYVFSIMAVFLFGDTFADFSTLGASLLTMAQVFTLDGWAENIVRPMMTVYPYCWIFFASYLLLSVLIVISFLMNVTAEVIEAVYDKKLKTKSRL